MRSLDFFSGVQRRGKPCCNENILKNTFEDGPKHSNFPSSYAWLYPTWKYFYSMKNTKKYYLQITCTNSSECAAFSLISIILPNKSLIVCLASSTSFSTERPTWDCSLTYFHYKQKLCNTVCKICSSSVEICSLSSSEYVFSLDMASSSGNYVYQNAKRIS